MPEDKCAEYAQVAGDRQPRSSLAHVVGGGARPLGEGGVRTGVPLGIARRLQPPDTDGEEDGSTAHRFVLTDAYGVGRSWKTSEPVSQEGNSGEVERKDGGREGPVLGRDESESRRSQAALGEGIDRNGEARDHHLAGMERLDG